MLQVLCSSTELEEYGEVLQVHDRVRRLGGRRRGRFFGTELDEVEWSFDRYAGVAGDGAVTISGLVVALQAVFVRLTQRPGAGWTVEPGSAHLEPIFSTAATRRPQTRTAWSELTPGKGAGRVVRYGHRVVNEGDEDFSSCLVTLNEERIDS